ncbi:hypothetical protein DPEC_G00027900 [Dallia pectoralis]|uniref:Uncharacterized protein n=1 Tax=Dallia pectoralis TaxID=75939 RepID=A0ACC2HIY7_DALPE|nr:hypothetical protein DPEC_G00027900 [Dallia pectoralis]
MVGERSGYRCENTSSTRYNGAAWHHMARGVVQWPRPIGLGCSSELSPKTLVELTHPLIWGQLCTEGVDVSPAHVHSPTNTRTRWTLSGLRYGASVADRDIVFLLHIGLFIQKPVRRDVACHQHLFGIQRALSLAHGLCSGPACRGVKHSGKGKRHLRPDHFGHSGLRPQTDSKLSNWGSN